MHLYVLTRGILSATKQWENDLAAQYLPFEVLENGKDKPTPYLAQLQVRPVNLYEIVFPEEALQEALGLVKPEIGKGVSGKFSKFISMFTKMMGLKKIPDYKKNIIPPGDGVSVIGLGLKKDKMNWKKKKVKNAGNNVFDIGMPKENL